MMQAQLPDGLRALMQASQILKQESSPVVQTPVGIKPTVAGQVTQGLEQVAGLRGAGQQAGLASQIQAQEMARQQQMAQDPEAIAQLAAQLMQQRQQPAQAGIANLPVNMEFKHGGIVGYNGESESDVRLTPVADREGLLLGSEEDTARALRETIRRAVANALQNSPAEVQDVGTPSLPSIGRSAARAAEASRQRQAERLQASRLQQPEAALGLGSTPMAPEPMPERELFTRPDAFVRPTAPQPSSRTADKPEDKSERQAPPPPPPSQTAAPTTPPSVMQTGIAVTPPTLQQIASEARGIVSDPYVEQRARREATAKEREKYLSGLPDLEVQGIAAIEQARRERQEALTASREDDNMRRFLAAMRSIGQRTGDYENALSQIAQREELNRKANLSETEAVLKLRQAQRERELGRFDRADALVKAASEEIKNVEDLRSKAVQSGASLAGQIFQGQTSYAATALREAGEERRKAQEIQMRKKELETNQQGQALIAAQGRVDSAMKSYNDALEKVRPLTMMKESDIKDEGMRNQVAEARRLIKTIEDEQLNPAIQYRDSLYSRILGTPPTSSRRSSTEGWGELKVQGGK